MNITIAAINLQSGVGTVRGHFHYALTGWKYWLPHSDASIKKCAGMLERENVDIGCVTEVSESSLRSSFKSQTEILAKAGHMEYSLFFSLQKMGKLFFHEGNALVSRYPISDFNSHLLPIELMKMGLDESIVEINGIRVSVFIAHLALGKNMRERQIKEIIKIVNKNKGPMIFAGDFNEPDPAAFDELRSMTPLVQLCTQKTFPSWKPVRSLDYILVSREFQNITCHVAPGPAFSDHAPLIMKTEL